MTAHHMIFIHNTPRRDAGLLVPLPHLDPFVPGRSLFGPGPRDTSISEFFFPAGISASIIYGASFFAFLSV